MPRVILASGTPAELALPTSSEPERGVVIAPDIMGLRPLFDDLAQRLAEDYRWAVIVVEPFPGRESMSLEERFEAIPGLTDERQLGDLVDAAGHVDGLVKGNDRVAVLGFCMGGMYALKAAGTGRFDRAVAFYGMIRLPEGWGGPGHGEPLDAVVKPGAAPVLAIVGTADRYTPPPDCDALEATGATVVRYEGAEHGFVHDASRPAHRADDAADAWRRVVGFLSYDNDEDSIDESA